MWWVVKAFYAKLVSGLVCGQANPFPLKMTEKPIFFHYFASTGFYRGVFVYAQNGDLFVKNVVNE
jgi:hypothetical protein